MTNKQGTEKDVLSHQGDTPEENLEQELEEWMVSLQARWESYVTNSGGGLEEVNRAKQEIRNIVHKLQQEVTKEQKMDYYAQGRVRGQDEGREAERKSIVEAIEKYIEEAEKSYKSAVSDQVAPYRHALENLLEIKSLITNRGK